MYYLKHLRHPSIFPGGSILPNLPPKLEGSMLGEMFGDLKPTLNHESWRANDWGLFLPTGPQLPSIQSKAGSCSRKIIPNPDKNLYRITEKEKTEVVGMGYLNSRLGQMLLQDLWRAVQK